MMRRKGVNMSLFTKPILKDYNILNYKDDFLLLHCSRNDLIYVPFDGKLKITDDGCILYNEDFELHLSHIQCTMHDDVKAGDIMGLPIVGKIDNRKIAYIGVKVYHKNKMQEPLIYLERRDKTVHNTKDKVEEAKAETKSQTKRKSNKKKK